jgi:hypothetical protein
MAAAFVAMVVVVDTISAALVYTMVPAVAVAMLSVGVPVVTAAVTAASLIHLQIIKRCFKMCWLIISTAFSLPNIISMKLSTYEFTVLIWLLVVLWLLHLLLWLLLNQLR